MIDGAIGQRLVRPLRYATIRGFEQTLKFEAVVACGTISHAIDQRLLNCAVFKIFERCVVLHLSTADVNTNTRPGPMLFGELIARASQRNGRRRAAINRDRHASVTAHCWQCQTLICLPPKVIVAKLYRRAVGTDASN